MSFPTISYQPIYNASIKKIYLLFSKRLSPCMTVKRRCSQVAYLDGPTHPALLDVTIPDHFKSIVNKYGDRYAHQKRKLTYDELDIESNSIAKGLQNLGVNKGDRCAVLLGNNIEFAILTYALFKLGAILVPLNPAFKKQQIVAALTHLSAEYLFISSETHLSRKIMRSNIDLLTELIPNIDSSGPFRSETLTSLRKVILIDNSSSRPDILSFKSLIPFNDLFTTNSANLSSDSPLSATEVVNIQFTSGTTSMPKAATLSHRNILNNGYSIGSRLRLTPNDTVICPPPLFHCFGCVLGYMATATHGATIGFSAECFDAEATLAMVREEQASALYGVPTMFAAEMEILASKSQETRGVGLENLRTGIAAGSSIPAQLMDRLHREMNLTELTICYGMTETSPVSCMTERDDPLEKQLDSVGKPLPHVSVKVVDPNDWRKTLRVSERGELAVAGYLLMNGYWGDSAKTAEVMKTDENGRVWILTGDEALIDSDGYVKITGRIKDLIIRGGENIHPLEIENTIYAYPGVAEVSVVGLPDPLYGEAVAAFIIPRDGVEVFEHEIKDWVSHRLSHHLIPKWVFVVDTYPKTASGKIQKFKLREQGIHHLKIQEE